MAVAVLRRAALLCLLAAPLTAEVQRVVILKVDGLPADVLERELQRVDPVTHKSSLPWIDHVFREGGARVPNFYVRAISLSAPSWSLLDTGQHLEIRGNAEFDRYTGHVYDYLNFFPFYVGYALSHTVDMPGVEVLDDLKIPLLIDRFPYAAVYQGPQLYQRGVRWKSLQNGLTHRFSHSLRELLDEWTIGFDIGDSVEQQTERELIAKAGRSRHPLPRLLHGRLRSRRSQHSRSGRAAASLAAHRRAGRPHLDRHRSQPPGGANRARHGFRSWDEHATRRLQPGLRSGPVSSTAARAARTTSSPTVIPSPNTN